MQLCCWKTTTSNLDVTRTEGSSCEVLVSQDFQSVFCWTDCNTDVSFFQRNRSSRALRTLKDGSSPQSQPVHAASSTVWSWTGRLVFIYNISRKEKAYLFNRFLSQTKPHEQKCEIKSSKFFSVVTTGTCLMFESHLLKIRWASLWTQGCHLPIWVCNTVFHIQSCHCGLMHLRELRAFNL